jgi:hypothetical protein
MYLFADVCHSLTFTTTGLAAAEEEAEYACDILDNTITIGNGYELYNGESLNQFYEI